MAVLPPFPRLCGAPGNSPEAQVASCFRRRAAQGPRLVAGVGRVGGRPAPARPPARPRSRPGPRGGWRAGARGVGRGAGGAGTCSPRATASPGQPRRGPGHGLRLPPGAAAQRMSPARLRRVYYAAGAGEPKRSRPRGPGGDGRRSRRGQVRLSLASLRARDGGQRGRRRAVRARQHGPALPSAGRRRVWGAEPPGRRHRRLCARPRCNKARQPPGPPPLRPPPARPPASRARGRRCGRGAQTGVGTACAPRASRPSARCASRKGFFPLLSARHLLEGETGEDAAGEVRGASRAASCALAPLSLPPPRLPKLSVVAAAAARLAPGPWTRPGLGARPGPSPGPAWPPRSRRRGSGSARSPRVRGPVLTRSPLAGSVQLYREETQFPF